MKSFIKENRLFLIVITAIFLLFSVELFGQGVAVESTKQKMSIRLRNVLVPDYGTADYVGVVNMLIYDTLAKSKSTNASVVKGGVIPPENWVKNGTNLVPAVVIDAISLEDGLLFSLADLTVSAENKNPSWKGNNNFRNNYNSATNVYNTAAIGYLDGMYITSGSSTIKVSRVVMLVYMSAFPANIGQPVNTIINAINAYPFEMKISVSYVDSNKIEQGSSIISMYTHQSIIGQKTRPMMEIVGVTGPVGNQMFHLNPNGDLGRSYVILSTDNLGVKSVEDRVVYTGQILSYPIFRGAGKFFSAVLQE